MNVLRDVDARKLALAGFFACVGLIAFAIYLQQYQGLEPCPLCMLQRLCFAGLGLIFLAAAIHGPQRLGMRIYAFLALAMSVTGASFAIRHVWLQWHPPEFNACTADLFYQLKKFPWLSVVERALRATGDCAVVDWTLLRLSIAEWSLVWFVLLGALAVAVFVRASTRRVVPD